LPVRKARFAPVLGNKIPGFGKQALNQGRICLGLGSAARIATAPITEKARIVVDPGFLVAVTREWRERNF
jgi:hypothetical protein